jgi:hypothetical protein
MSDKIYKSRVTSQQSFTWFLGFIGAFIYYIVQATGFWMAVAGFFKAIVWPAFLVYELFEYLKM